MLSRTYHLSSFIQLNGYLGAPFYHGALDMLFPLSALCHLPGPLNTYPL